MAYSLTEAAVAASRNRSSILRALKSGRLSATRDETTGEWRIEPAELHRLYPVADASGAAPDRNSGAPAEIQELRARLTDKDTTIAEQRAALDDLRRRLDQADTDRRQALDRLAAAQERIAALLTDQRLAPAPARRSWWHWGRKLGIAAAVWVAACGPALAMENGKVLLEGCLQPAGSSGRDYCLGYVTGIANALQLVVGDVCVPEKKTRRQVVNVAVSYLQAHPERGHHLAAALVRAALVEAFPCGR